MLQRKPDQPPSRNMADYWEMLSKYLTTLDITVDQAHKQVLQPTLLQSLCALTSLTFTTVDDEEYEHHPENTFELPELKVLNVTNYWGRHLILNCPKLTRLQMIESEPLGLISLHASLQELSLYGSPSFGLQEAFPLSNLFSLTSLTIEHDPDSEEELFRGLPLMSRLSLLDICVHGRSLPASLPLSMRKINMYFTLTNTWDSMILQIFQELPDLDNLQILICAHSQEDCHGIAGLDPDCQLSPFMGLKRLRKLHLGDYDTWNPSALRLLGRFQAQLSRSGSKIDFHLM